MGPTSDVTYKRKPLNSRIARWTQIRKVYSLNLTDALGRALESHEAPGDMWVEIEITLWLPSGEWGCVLVSRPKLALGRPNNL